MVAPAVAEMPVAPQVPEARAARAEMVRRAVWAVPATRVLRGTEVSVVTAAGAATAGAVVPATAGRAVTAVRVVWAAAVRRVLPAITADGPATGERTAGTAAPAVTEVTLD